MKYVSCVQSLAIRLLTNGLRVQSVNLLRNKGPKATYKSQYTIYNDYTARQCIQYAKNHASEKALYKLSKIHFTVQ